MVGRSSCRVVIHLYFLSFLSMLLYLIYFFTSNGFSGEIVFTIAVSKLQIAKTAKARHSICTSLRGSILSHKLYSYDPVKETKARCEDESFGSVMGMMLQFWPPQGGDGREYCWRDCDSCLCHPPDGTAEAWEVCARQEAAWRPVSEAVIGGGSCRSELFTNQRPPDASLSPDNSPSSSLLLLLFFFLLQLH